jgi:NAD+ synthase (glutamine-hydrolysing)
MARAERDGVDLLVFPELAVTGYTCADLFQQIALQRDALDALDEIVAEGESIFSGLTLVGVPVALDDQLFNCAAVIHQGQLLGMVPKTFIPNYKEFYEGRWFASAATARSTLVQINGRSVPFGTDLLFRAVDVDGLLLGVEICEDLWVPVPPSSLAALHGASVLANLSASNEVIGKCLYRRELVINQSARCLATYVYAGCGVGESSTDVVFGGHALIAENGTLLSESRRFEQDETIIVSDSDLDRIRVDRMRMNSFGDVRLYLGMKREYRQIEFRLAADHRRPFQGKLRRQVSAHPFVPAGQHRLRERCEDIFNIQVAGLTKRLEHLSRPPVVIGISGGLDSTLALLVACRTFDLMSVPREKIHALTLPGYGTTTRTRGNARSLMEHLGVCGEEIDIRPLCLAEMQLLGHRPFGIDLEGLDDKAFSDHLMQLPAERGPDLVFENVQARIRTNMLMSRGFVIGTGDLSELALGWCTYNADQMSMYNPNVSVPKTLVKFLVRWAAENEFEGEARQTLLDIVATEISPELLPSGQDGHHLQLTEREIGPYELHDFFLFHFLRYGTPPQKILFLAGQTRFDKPYSEQEIRHWLRLFLTRFFANQFKRSAMPDGPKVGSVSLSPRGDWRMPSDAQTASWLKQLDDASPVDAGKVETLSN